MNSGRSYLWALYAGALLGMLAALGAILFPAPALFDNNDTDVAATVNGVPILASRYREQLDAVRVDRRDDLTPDLQQRVLDRLIDEELLVQNGLDTGFAESERGVRSAIVNAVIATVLAEVAARQPSDKELQTFYKDNLELFKPEDRLMVRRISTADTIVSLPAGPLPLTELRKYIAPSVVAKLALLPEGQAIAGANGEQFLLEQRLPGQAPSFAENRAVVAQAYRQMAGAKALNDYLAMLRKQATIETFNGKAEQ